MNPFLERDDVWPDFHHRFIERMAEAIADHAAPRYLVRIAADSGGDDTPGCLDHAFLEIWKGRARAVVTVIELLCPANKGRYHEQYLLKRRMVLTSSAELVEVDLLRGGQPMPTPGRPECDYSVLVSRAAERPRTEFWPISLRESLPVVPIPLRAPDPDVTLNLQALLHKVYDTGHYARYIYDKPPQPSLTPDNDAWASQFVPTQL
jgi:hypothetical protein